MEVNIIQINCCNCGVSFWITQKHNQELIQSRNTFHCPNGHSQNYIGETEAEKIKKEMDKKLQACREVSERHEKKKAELFEDLAIEKNNSENLKKSIRGYKGMLGRYKKEKGVIKYKAQKRRNVK